VLASLAEFKLHIDKSTNDTSGDELLTTFLDWSTSLIQGITDRNFDNGTYVEYVDGTGFEELQLREGPVTSVSAVSEVTWDSSAVESLLAVTDFRILHHSGNKLPGRLLRLSSDWARGRHNYKAEYTAGYVTIPNDLKYACLFAAQWIRGKRKDSSTISRDIGSGSERFRPDRVLMRELKPWVGPYMVNPGKSVLAGDFGNG